jgi:hypothetical protein
MPRGPLNFRQRDLTAAVKAVKNAGENVARVKVDRDGNFVVYVGNGNKAAPTKISSLERLIDDEEVRLHPKLRRV